MPAIQTAYAETMPVGYPGLVANMETANSISRTVEDAAGIGFGLAAFQGAADLGITKTPGTLFRGVTIADKTLLAAPGAAVDTYAKGDTAALQEKGVIWVTASVAVTPGQPAYVTPAGAWTNVTTANTAIPNAIFDSTAAIGGLAKLRIR